MDYTPALDAGFSRRDVIDPSVYIAQGIAKAYVTHPDTTIATSVVMAATRYQSHDWTPEDRKLLPSAITGLDTCPEPKAIAMDIANLLRVFADFTQTHPEDVTAENWRQEIKVNAAMLLDWAQDVDAPSDIRSQAALTFIATHHGSLWS